MRVAILTAVLLAVLATPIQAGAARPGKAPAWVVGNNCAQMLDLQMPYWTCRWSTASACTWTEKQKADYDQCMKENL